MNGLEQLPARVTAVERKVDGLSTQVDLLSTQVHLLSAREDERYQQTAAAFADQRSYTDSVLARMESGFALIDSRFALIDSRFALIDSRFERVETSLGRLERKLDGLIDTQTRTNAIAERRLRRLEARGVAISPRPPGLLTILTKVDKMDEWPI